MGNGCSKFCPCFSTNDVPDPYEVNLVSKAKQEPKIANVKKGEIVKPEHVHVRLDLNRVTPKPSCPDLEIQDDLEHRESYFKESLSERSYKDIIPESLK